MAVDRERPRVYPDLAILYLIVDLKFLVAVVPGQDAHGALRGSFKAKGKGNIVTQVRDAVDTC
jgi:hypothetical protein